MDTSGPARRNIRSNGLMAAVHQPSLEIDPRYKENTDSDEIDRHMSLRRYLMPPPVPGMVNWGVPAPTKSIDDPELETKFRRFADLKGQGKHFNESLMTNKAFKNPHLYAKLVEFVNVDENVTNHPSGVWDPFRAREEWFSEAIGTPIDRILAA
ncbi:hypothetical protein FRC17_003782 [Serendipita sp. 399]|nr:hypothetical protein FRC17_003782 [Serendipita sp. 399]